jgi:hypothetical protein
MTPPMYYIRPAEVSLRPQVESPVCTASAIQSSFHSSSWLESGHNKLGSSASNVIASTPVTLFTPNLQLTVQISLYICNMSPQSGPLFLQYHLFYFLYFYPFILTSSNLYYYPILFYILLSPFLSPILTLK